MRLWRSLFGKPKDLGERLNQRADAAEKMLRKAGVPIDQSNTITELKRSSATIDAFGCLGLKKDPALDKIDPEIAKSASAAVFRYRDAIQAALSQVPINKIEAATRDAAIFGARRALSAALPRSVMLTADIVARMDGSLGFPPIDPTLGVP